jgi:hypothetical protein
MKITGMAVFIRTQGHTTSRTLNSRIEIFGEVRYSLVKDLSVPAECVTAARKTSGYVYFLVLLGKII